MIQTYISHLVMRVSPLPRDDKSQESRELDQGREDEEEEVDDDLHHWTVLGPQELSSSTNLHQEHSDTEVLNRNY